MLDSVDLETRLADILDAHRGMEGALLPILHAVQAAFGHVPQEALPIIAKDLNISKAEAHGVMSFYHDFREKPAGRSVLKLCRAEACQAQGSDALAAAVQAKLGLDWHETSADGTVTLEPVFCLGLCACGPAAMVDGQLVGRATVETLLAKVRA
ncbi:MAG: formate dehydrogenase subunit gamma [Rhodobacter sp.]|jgi:formate dehydrogenase subunit gamma|nr:formate dehydrogenase subunit gamma [Rhodobacter sp.]